jgi:ABC-type multidrug transport system ATPase subunit
MEQFNESDTSLWQDMNATIANAADGSTAIQGCGEPLANAYTGKLVFVERGNCTFFDKLHNAALGGARAVVVFDTASASSTALNSNFRLPTGAIAPPVAEQQAVQGVPIFGVSFRTWSIIHPSVATAAAGESFSGASSPGPRYFTLKCAAALDLSDNTAVSNQWTQLASTSVFDSYDPIIFNVSACPDAIVADRDCIQTRAGCTAGFYCPYGNLPLEVTSPDIYAEIACNTSDLDYDETNCCLTNLTTGFVECKCPLGFYCPINTSQPLYCFEGFECREPATIRTCPVGTFCPYATVKAFECLFFDTCEEGSTKPDRWRLILFVFIVFVILQILLAARASYMKEYEHRADQHLEDYHRDREKRMERMNQAVHTMHRNNEISDAEKKKCVVHHCGWSCDSCIRDAMQCGALAWIANLRVVVHPHACCRYLDYHARQSAHHIDNENVLRKNLGIHTVQEEAEIHAELRKSAVVIVVDNNGVPIGKRHRSGIQGPVAMDTDIPVTDLDDDAESDDGVEMKTAHRPSTLGEIVQRTVTVGFDEGNNLIHGGVAEESLTLLDSPIDGGAEIAYDIEFENIGMTLPTGQTIMEGVSGKFMSGTLTAIMGPSGAGKTTILSLVTGRSKKTHGSITVNGNVVSGLAKWKREVAFVPQDDVMHTDLTVRENIMFNARLRLPREWTEDEIREHVDWILDTLEIDHIQHTVVGDTRKRGVSGGQRKRVNIGMELAAFPSIVFLDEPTSGLDSTTATELVQLLKKLAQAHHLTIAAVIHAPTPRAFEQFDMLLLLQKGGRTAYFGEVGAGEIGPPAECFARLG